MRVHVTGGSGFLGKRVVPALVARGHSVSALARSDAAAATVSALGAQPIEGDLDDVPSVEAAFAASKADALVNVASLGFGHAGAIVRAAESAGLRRAIFVSTTSIFTSLNAASKNVRIAAEDAIRASALDWTIVRPTMIYGGPDDRNMSRLLRLLRRTAIVPLPGGGRRLQQPVHVEDVAAAIVAAVDAPASVRRAYDVAGPEPLSLRGVVTQAGQALGRDVRAVPVPIAPAVVALRAYEKLARRPRLRAEQVERLAEDKAFDISAARRDLDFEPRAFAEGIRTQAGVAS